MDHFRALKYILSKNTIRNLETLHNCQIVNVTSGYLNTKKISEFELLETLQFLPISYNYKENLEDIETELINNGHLSITLIWGRKIVVFALQLRKCWGLCGKQKYSYLNTSYFLDLHINQKIFNPELKKILEFPTKGKIRKFVGSK